MATTKKRGSGFNNKDNDHAALPKIPLPSGVGAAARTPGSRTVLPVAVIDFDHEKLQVNWQKIIDSQRKSVETDVLKITPPRSKLDPIAKAALDSLRKKLIEKARDDDDSDEASFPRDMDKYVRDFITRKGIASEVKKVTDRLNARRITDGRRWVLATTYEFLLAQLFRGRPAKFDELIKDDLGVAEKIMLELEATNGPFDVFINLIVESVMERNRINQSDTLKKIVSQQIRAAI